MLSIGATDGREPFPGGQQTAQHQFSSHRFNFHPSQHRIFSNKPKWTLTQQAASAQTANCSNPNLESGRSTGSSGHEVLVGVHAVGVWLTFRQR